MPLTTALYTGLSGLTVNQVALDVIGNNISNVNTYAFKGSRPLFDPEFSQTYNMGSAPGAVYGGSNPYQKGLGAVTSGIQRDFGQGNIKPTKAGDMAIQGDGMFVLDGPQRSYTRNGAFQVNSAEYLVSGDGNYLLGYGVDKNFNVIPGKLQRIQIPKDMVIVQPTSEMQLQGDLNPSGIVATQGTVLQSTAIQMSDGSAVLDTSHLVDLLNASGLQMFNVGDTLTLSADRGGNTAPTQTMVVSDTTSVGDLMNMMAGNMGVNTAGAVFRTWATGNMPWSLQATLAQPTR
jgi:flagellar hook-basal body protein